ncbi:MAG: DUF1015 domain-containing protein [Thermodesulfobacteriota bacterium]|nr:DUF1015 domain-containing protein [Thermodesulfobacteriota bacterium]
MAIIAPFRGMTYNFRRLGNISKLVAPPYDVITEEEQEHYYQTDNYNVIRLILGKKKRGDSDWDNRYTRSADDFKRWEREDVLIRSDYPSMYITSLEYDPGDGIGPRVRWGIIALVRIEEEKSGVILPHEKIFSAHKDDRLKLMRACNAQFSQIFGLYEDSENITFDSFKNAVDVPPPISFDFKDGTRHRMWIIKDQFVFKSVAEFMHNKPVIIADGHHRYATSRDFRNIMRTRHGSRPQNRSYEYVMMYLTNMYDKGLTILPSHRLIKRCAEFQLEPFFEKIKQWFDISVMTFSDSNGSSMWLHLKRMLEQKGLTASVMGFYLYGDKQCYLLSLKPGLRNEMGDDLHPALRKLDVMVLSRFILQKGLGFSKEDLDNEEIFHYESDLAKACSLVETGTYKMAFLLNPTKIDQVKEVADHSLIMPRKSTYFYPKILTGLVFNKINPHETIQI